MNDQRTVFAKKFEEKLVLNTDLLSDAENIWLKQLVMSPMVFLQDGADVYPVEIDESNYSENKHVVDGAKNLSVTLKFNTSYKTQFR
jgi:hypothetical protein